jgi:hypothetical protein
MVGYVAHILVRGHLVQLQPRQRFV